MVLPDGVFSLGVRVLFMFYSPGFHGLPGVASHLIVPRSPPGVKHLKTSDNKEHHEQTRLKTSKTKSREAPCRAYAVRVKLKTSKTKRAYDTWVEKERDVENKQD